MRRRWGALILPVVVLAACGGSGGGNESATEGEPGSEETSIDDGEVSGTTPGTARTESNAGLAREASSGNDQVVFVTSTSTTTTTTTTLPPTTSTTSTTTTTVPAATTTRCSLAADALFEPGKSVLNPTAIEDLEAIVAGATDIRRVTVEGHTDHRGTDEANLALSQARADAAAEALAEAGIDEGLITAVGLGEGDADQDDPTDAEMAEDRRVDIVIEADVPITSTC